HEANPIPTTSTLTLESLAKVHTNSELDSLPYSIFSDDYRYYAIIDFVSPSGTIVESFYKEIHETYDGGTIEITSSDIEDLLIALGPGISSIRVYVAESEFYKKSPTVSIPLEIKTPNWLQFGEKNTQINLINPLISAWGAAYDNGEEMPFESNYPHIIGSIWIDPDFMGTGEEIERSIQDYIEINLDVTIYNDDGTASTFPLQNNVMLRPGNRDGILTFRIGLGPENAFLMGMQCDLNLSFNIDFNKDKVYEDLRDVEIYLLDLRIEANPSSSTPSTTWSIYDNGFASPEIGVIKEVSVEEQTGILYLGGTENGQIYGQDISFLFNNDTLDYGIDANSELLSLNALSEITALKVNGIKDGDNYEFIQGIDWNMPYNPSGILYNDSVIHFLEATLPDEGTELSVTYKLKFDFTGKSFGKITLGYSNDYNESSIEIQLPQGFLPESNKSYSAMFTRFNQSGAGLVSVYSLDYGRQNAVLSDFIIYNEAELETLNADYPISKTIVSNHLEITFTQGAPNTPFNVDYGVKSQYSLSYGFQKLNKSYSDSIRLMYNDTTAPKILDESNNEL
ncbi:hypothetical protein LCGC14_2323260, partial [marine sediment metagenome]